jgi:hypothetical protein
MALPDLGHFPDLCPVRFDGSPFPGILGKESGINADLGCEKSHHIGGDLRPRAGKTAFVVQALE